MTLKNVLHLKKVCSNFINFRYLSIILVILEQGDYLWFGVYKLYKIRKRKDGDIARRISKPK